MIIENAKAANFCDILFADKNSLKIILDEAVSNLVDDMVNPCKDPLEKRKLKIELTLERSTKYENKVYVDFKVKPEPAPYCRVESTVPEGQMKLFGHGTEYDELTGKMTDPSEEE